MEGKQVASQDQDLKRGIAEWQVAFIGLGGVIVFGLMISYAKLLVNLPRSGSFIAYTNEFLGPTVSTGFGWRELCC